MATLHLMVGLPGSGKTTEAKKLEQEYRALRLTPDEWQYFLFGHDISDLEHDERHTKVEELMWEIAVKVCYCSHITVPRGVSAHFCAELPSSLARNRIFLRFLCIAKRVTGHGVNQCQ